MTEVVYYFYELPTPAPLATPYFDGGEECRLMGLNGEVIKLTPRGWFWYARDKEQKFPI